MTDLGQRLERLGLSQYLEAFVAEGFDTWETVLDITESDLTSLNVKLGHRRRLQRAIAESRGQSHDRPLPIALGKSTSIESAYRSDDSAPESKAGKQGDTTSQGAGATSTKRKYRRHPKADEHAPERPPSAYVIFSNQMREQLKGHDLSFTEIAKVVGERWQVLPAESREACERQANAAKEKYYAELAEYKKTPQYEAYQRYLEEFKAKHAAPSKAGTEGKRSKLETETSVSTRSSSHEHADRALDRRVSLGQEPFSHAQPRGESSPPVGYSRLPPQPYPTKSTSPATHSLSGFNSPRMGEHYSPISASPRSATLQKESSFEYYPNTGSGLSRDSKDRLSDPSIPPGSSSTTLPPPTASSTTPPLAGYVPQYQHPIDLPSRRSFREPTRLPPLTHDDTTLSSDSGGGHGGQGGPLYSGSLLPVVDASKSMRVLPQPIPTLGPSASPLDQRLQPPASSGHPQEFRPSSSMAALLRAGELARVADDEAMDKDSSP